jgi:hypothetical protein
MPRLCPQPGEGATGGLTETSAAASSRHRIIFCGRLAHWIVLDK